MRWKKVNRTTVDGTTRIKWLFPLVPRLIGDYWHWLRPIEVKQRYIISMGGSYWGTMEVLRRF